MTRRSAPAPSLLPRSGRDPSGVWRRLVARWTDWRRPPTAYIDPLDRWRLIRVSTDLLSQFGTRTEDGYRITAEWGEPDEQGVYEPTFTTHWDDGLSSARVHAAVPPRAS